MNTQKHIPSIKTNVSENFLKIDESFKNDESNIGMLDENDRIRSEFEYMPNIIDDQIRLGNQIRIGTREQNSSSTSKTFEEIEKKGENNIVYIKKTRKIEITDIVEKKIPERVPSFDKVLPQAKADRFKSVDFGKNSLPPTKVTPEKPDIDELLNSKEKALKSLVDEC